MSVPDEYKAQGGETIFPTVIIVLFAMVVIVMLYVLCGG